MTSGSATLDRCRFVLVEPQSAGNVGSAARALKNLGFRRLDVVAPRCEPRGPEARRLAVDAADLLDAARIHDDLDAALGGAVTVVGTSRRAGKHRKPHWRVDALALEIAATATAIEVAVVFGREEHGLTDAELDRCTHLAYLPAAAAYPSFNLAQAVLLVAWELRRAAVDGPAPDASDALEPPADHARREAMYAHLEQAWLAIGFLKSDSREVVMRRLRRAVGRAALSCEEVKLLRGVARQTLWVARRAGLEIPSTGSEAPGDDEGDAGTG